MTQKELKIKKNIEEEISLEKIPKRIPKGIKNKEKDKLISSAYIIENEDGRKIIVSGGYKVFLYIVHIQNNREDMCKKILKQKNWEQYREYLRVMKREKLFGVQGRLTSPYDFEQSDIILEETSSPQKQQEEIRK